MAIQAGPGDLVAVTLPRGPAAAEALSEIWRSGAAALPVGDRLPREAARRLAENAGPGRVEEDIALVVATSGTEREPRLVELSRGAVGAAVELSLEAMGADRAAPWLCVLPHSHIGGLLVILRAAITGAPVEVHERFDVERFVASDARYASIVPTMLRRLVDARVALDRFDAILVGGAALEPSLRESAEGLGARIIETYGSTETCGGVVYDGVPFRGVTVDARDDGRIRVAGPTLMRRYRDDPDATRAAFDEAGRFITSDLGRIAAGGRLEVLGRADDAITTGGETLMPEPIEACLATHPAVADVAVVGRGDAEWGERVVAFVVPRGTPPTLEALRSHAMETLPVAAAPRELVIVEALPRTPSGKVRRAALR